MAAAATVGAVAGTKFYIGTAESVASPDDWVEVKEISNLGDIGTTFAKIVVETVGSGYTKQIKGTESAPVFDLVMNRLADDPGQIALRAAAAVRNSLYNFRILDNDTEGNTTPTTITFRGRIYGAPFNYGGVNDLKRMSTSIEVEPDTIVVTAAV